MLIEYNKFTILVYFITATTITFAARRWIYGLSILLLSASILLHKTFMNEIYLVKYSHFTQSFSLVVFVGLIIMSLFVLNKSSIELNHKIFSMFFLSLSLLYTLIKNMYQLEPVFNTVISKYISTLIFMIFLWSVGFINDNQAILQMKVDEYKDKIKRF